MLLHTIVATDEVMLSPAKIKTEMTEINGRWVEFCKTERGCYVNRIVSTDPRDYLNVRLFPSAEFDKSRTSI